MCMCAPLLEGGEPRYMGRSKTDEAVSDLEVGLSVD